MIVRRYTGSSMEQIRDTIAKELGPKAVIVHSERKKKSGILPGLNNYILEVTAVADDAVDASAVRNAPAATTAAPVTSVNLEPLLETQKQQYRGIRRSMQLLDEKLADMEDRLVALTEREPQPGTAPSESKNEHQSVLRNVHQQWHNSINKLAFKLSHGKAPNERHWQQALTLKLNTLDGLHFQPCAPGKLPPVYVMAGPTGVGKTTTLAKLAAKCVLSSRLKVGIITLDTFRLAGVEQLREYAELMGIEMKVAFSASELQTQLELFNQKDVIFIDTPGRSQFDQEGIHQIREKLGTQSRTTTLLTVTANTRREDIPALIRNYNILAPSALIITKSDETTCCDGLTLLQDITNIPFVYITDGQRVPEDIHEATGGLVASMIMPSSKTARSTSNE